MRKFRDLLSWGANFFLAYFFDGAIFFNTLFYKLFFHENDITCIITVVGPQQQHKGMFLKYGAWGGGGGKNFPTLSCHSGDHRGGDQGFSAVLGVH